MPDQITFKVEAYEVFNTSFVVADGTQISRGILLQSTDPRTASKCTNTSLTTPQVHAGIAAMEKEAGDGSTHITLWRKGIFDSVASGAIANGGDVIFVADGYIAELQGVNSGNVASGGRIAGTALETAANNERIEWSMDL